MRLVRLLTLLLIVFALSACAGNQQVSENENNKNGGISITDFSERTITFSKVPSKIVALGNGETDIIYALGHQVVGRPNGKPVVKEVKEALEVGSTHNVDLEKITSLQPDVVLGNEPMNRKDIRAIENIGAKMVLTNASSVDDIKKQITLFGNMLKEQEKAKELIQTIDKKIDELQQASANSDKPRVLLVYGAPGTNMVALPNSLGGNLLEIAGGENIAKDYPSLEMYPQYAQLNTERVVEANPQLILLMTHGNPEEVKNSFMKDISQIAGWKELDAVKNDQVHILPSDLFGTNPGTRVVDALDYLYDLLQDVKE
mgnify:CR=1 FL=1